MSEHKLKNAELLRQNEHLRNRNAAMRDIFFRHVLALQSANKGIDRLRRKVARLRRELGTAQVAPVCADLTDRTGHASQSDGSTPSPAGPIELGDDAPPEILAAREHGRVDMAYKLAQASGDQISAAWSYAIKAHHISPDGPSELQLYVRKLCKIVREQPEPEEPTDDTGE